MAATGRWRGRCSRSYDLQLGAVTVDDAEQAAIRMDSGQWHVSRDRLCLALGQRLGATVWTADNNWGTSETIRQIR